MNSFTRFISALLLLAALTIPCLALRPDHSTLKSQNIALNPPYNHTRRLPSATQIQLAQDAEQTGLTIKWNSRLGTPFSIRGKKLGQRHAFSRGKGLIIQGKGLYEQDAVAVLDNLSGVFAIKDAEAEFTLKKLKRENTGFYHVRMNQVYQQLKVIGGQVIVHFNNKGEAYEVNGNYIPDIDIEVTPGVDSAEAVRIAQADLSKSNVTLVKCPDLVVFAYNTEPSLAYELLLVYDDQTIPGRWRYWIDAKTGTVLLCFNEVKTIAAPTSNGSHANITGNILSGEGGSSTTVTGWYENTGYYYLYNKNRYWYIYNVASSGYTDSDTYAYRNNSIWGIADRAEVSAANNFNAIQEYYSVVHSRNSFDNSGTYARVNVHQGTNYVNAYWDGTDFHVGDGDGAEANCLAVLDVCAHEFTHAVTANSAKLFYYGESGALNESFSDIFGACVEFYAQPDGSDSYPSVTAGYADWLIGEDCWLDGTALRDLRNPGSTVTLASGYQLPSRYHGTDWYYGSGDNAGVHYNMSVQSFAFYLLSVGGIGTNDEIRYSVTGIAVTNAEKVAYRALTVYFTEYTDYTEARSAWISAASDLNTNWVSSVAQAWAAIDVGVDTQSITLGNAVDAPLLTWYTGGVSNWFEESTDTYDSIDAAQSGVIQDGEQSRIYTTVTGPGTLYFWWKVSSEANWDFLRFYINETEQTNISGLSNWQNLSFSLPSGEHTLKWQYTKDGSVKGGSDAGWLDQVVWFATPTPSEGTVKNDFNGDGITDMAIYQESTGYWFIIMSGDYSLSTSKLGELDYTPVPGDFDGDGKTDMAVYQESTGYWFIIKSSDYSLSTSKLGELGYTPVPGDFDGDGKTDMAVYQESTGYWFIIMSSTGGLFSQKFGETGYIPVW